MRKFFCSIMFCLLANIYTCGQNGPTQPSVALSWVQSTTTGITANCIYRSTGNGTVPAPPALFCSTSPITTYTDTTVSANTDYVYSVTAKQGSTESGYSSTAAADVGAPPNAPTNLIVPTVVAKNEGSLGIKVIWSRK